MNFHIFQHESKAMNASPKAKDESILMPIWRLDAFKANAYGQESAMHDYVAFGY